VLKVIEQRDYSQFPVYASERFLGLLTENGITRWLAHHVTSNLSLVELEKVSVKEVLENEEARKNCKFVAKDIRVNAIVGQFVSQETLEAVLITSNGTESVQERVVYRRPIAVVFAPNMFLNNFTLACGRHGVAHVISPSLGPTKEQMLISDVNTKKRALRSTSGKCRQVLGSAKSERFPSRGQLGGKLVNQALAGNRVPV
jgi:hypothetical protein